MYLVYAPPASLYVPLSCLSVEAFLFASRPSSCPRSKTKNWTAVTSSEIEPDPLRMARTACDFWRSVVWRYTAQGSRNCSLSWASLMGKSVYLVLVGFLGIRVEAKVAGLVPSALCGIRRFVFSRYGRRRSKVGWSRPQRSLS